MKRIPVFLPLMFSLAARAGALTPSDAVQKITWYGQNSLRVELAGKVVWIDPVGVAVSEKADVILLTHNHGDHYSASDVKKLSGCEEHLSILGVIAGMVVMTLSLGLLRR